MRSFSGVDLISLLQGASEECHERSCPPHVCQRNVTIRFTELHVLVFLRQLVHKTAQPHPWFAGSQRSLGKNRMQKSRQLVRERAMEFAAKVIFAHDLSSLQSTEASDDIIKGGHRIRVRSLVCTFL